MTICRYFLEGKCRYGDKCRFEHPRGGAQRNLFGGGGDNWSNGGGGGQRVTFRDSFGTANQQGGGASHNPYKWSAGQQDSQGPSTQDLVNNLPKEMEIWEKSKMWPFSSLSADKDLESLPEFYDVSVEELRMEAYEALKSNNIQPYVQKIQGLTNEFQTKRNQLKHMTMDVKQKLVAYIDEARKKKQSSSSMASSSTFGNQPSQSTFGQNPSASSNPFGQNPSASSNPFGQPNQSMQSGNTTSLFGKPASSSGSTFGGGNTGSGAGLFGSPGLFGKPSTGTSSVFGGQTQNTSSANPFMSSFSGSQTTSQGLFGSASTSTQPGSVFGGLQNPGTQQQQQQPPSLFGSAPTQAPQGLFGKPAAVGTSSPFSSMQPAASSSTPNLFGQQPASGQQTLFGKPVANPSPQGNSTSQGQSLFGNPQPFGTTPTQPAGHATTTAATTTTGSAVNPGRFTPLEDLTDLEKAEFQASAFTLGRIPLRPPPKELINI